MNRSLAKLVLLSGWACSCGGLPDLPDPAGSGPVDRIPRAVGGGLPDGNSSLTGGKLDHPGEFPFVGYLKLPSGHCSAVLISPTMVATANHCITGDTSGLLECLGGAHGEPIDMSDSDFTVYFVPDVGPSGIDPSAVPVAYRGVHTFAKSGPILVRTHDPIDACGNDDSPHDMALIPLDNRIQMQDVLPLHTPAQGAPNCGDVVPDDDDFVGQLVGFGRVGFDAIFTGDLVQYRNAQLSEDWDREDVGTGMIYRNRWLVLNDYLGSQPGDSGGPLLTKATFADPSMQNLSHKVFCGVVSRNYFVFPAEVGDDISDVADGGNDQMIRDHIFTASGQIKGECNKVDLLSGSDRDKDSDGDHIPDACDPCPMKADVDSAGRPTYNDLPTPDADGDGIPDRCDVCPTGHDPPIITPPPQITLDSCEQPSSMIIGKPSGLDCGGGTLTFTNNAPARFDIGLTIVTWTATSSATGLTATGQQLVIVQGIPHMNAPADVNLHCATGNIGTPTVNDLCTSVPPTINNNAPASFPPGTTEVTWTAKSAASGLSATATQKVTNLDDGLSLTAPPDVTLHGCGSAAIGSPKVSDLCSTTAPTITHDPTTFGPGITFVTWTATSATGKQVSVTQEVTVLDDAPPVVTAPPDLVIASCAGSTVDPGTPKVLDQCDGTSVVDKVTISRTIESRNGQTVSQAIAAGARVFEPGTTVIRYDVRDANGAVVTVRQKITVGAAPTVWTLNHGYKVGDRVTFGGQVYECLTAHTSITGWEPPGNQTLWRIPTPCGIAAWHTDTQYLVGSVVTFNGHSFKCRQAHVSIPSWAPGPATASLWLQL
jgi:hypothetical protein